MSLRNHCFTLFFSLCFALPAFAQTAAGNGSERQAIEQLRATTLALIEALVNQGLLSRERADALLRQATPAAPTREPQGSDPPRTAAAAASAPPVVRVPYISETLRAQLREEIKNEVLVTAREERWADPRALPDWLRGITIEGDVRVRGEHDGFRAPGYGASNIDPCNIVSGNLPAECFRTQANSPAWAPDISNTTNNRDRMTLRARLSALATVGDDTTAALRLSTGTTSGPTSSSQTLGQGFNKASVVLDRAWLRWEPRHDLRAWAGRMQNPFFGTDLLWPDDINLDGIAVQAEGTLGSGLFAFGTAGAFPIGEVANSRRDKWLYAAQMGIDWSPDGRWQWRTGLAVYDFHRIEGQRETALPPSGARDGTTDYLSSEYPASVRLKGNTLIALNAPNSTSSTTTWGLASKFRPVNLSTALTLKYFDPIEATLTLDWVRNMAFDMGDINRRAGVNLNGLIPEKTTGLQARLTVGPRRLANRGDWQVFAALRRFERDAWVDGYTDTTWHLGGTSYQGFSVGGAYNIDRRTSLGLRLTSTHNLDDGWRAANNAGNLSSAPLRIDVLQLDLNARF